MKKIIVEVIPANEMRYETIGDWWIDPDGTWRIQVAEFEDERHSMGIAYHELREMMTSWVKHVQEPEVTKFDLWFEEETKAGRIPDTLDEPGNHPKCPYNSEHQKATSDEMGLMTDLDCNWWEYDEAVRKMSREQVIKNRKVDANGASINAA
jgi:hypothetical protein